MPQFSLEKVVLSKFLHCYFLILKSIQSHTGSNQLQALAEVKEHPLQTIPKSVSARANT